MANFFTYGSKTIHAGDTVQVHYKLIEKETVSGKAKKEKKEEIRERIQIFEGIVIAIRGRGENRSFTVRKIGVGGIGIERIFSAISPWIKDITVKRSGSVRRAKLYYLRGKIGREANRLKEKEEAPETKQASQTTPAPKSAPKHASVTASTKVSEPASEKKP